MSKYSSAAGNRFNLVLGSQGAYYQELDKDRANGCIRDLEDVYKRQAHCISYIKRADKQVPGCDRHSHNATEESGTAGY